MDRWIGLFQPSMTMQVSWVYDAEWFDSLEHAQRVLQARFDHVRLVDIPNRVAWNAYGIAMQGMDTLPWLIEETDRSSRILLLPSRNCTLVTAMRARAESLRFVVINTIGHAVVVKGE